ncbi:MAG: hypothetical protein P1P88_06805 [Bacteroidales bacterium]|nr:hypothetical protein [Bacteroidales bacterium]
MDIASSFDFRMVWSALSGLGSLVVFGICVYFVIAKPAIDSILLVIGSFIHMLTSLFYSVGMVIFSNIYGMDVYSNRWIFSIIGFISLIGTICFTAGLIILIINYVNQYKRLRMDV